MKRTVSFIIVMAMLLSLVPAAVFANDPVSLPEIGYYYTGTYDAGSWESTGFFQYEDLQEHDGEKTVWILKSDGFSAEELTYLTVSAFDHDFNDVPMTTTTAPAVRAVPTDNWDVAVQIPAIELESDLTLHFGYEEPGKEIVEESVTIFHSIRAHALYFNYEGDDYVAGLSANYGDYTQSLVINEDICDMPLGEFSGVKSEENRIVHPRSFTAVAATKNSDGEYFEASQFTVKITGLELEHQTGDENAITLSKTAIVRTVSPCSIETPDGFIVAVKENYTERAIVWAYIEVYDDETLVAEGTAGYLVSSYRENAVYKDLSAGNLADLQAYLDSLPGLDRPDGYTKYFIKLASEYSGEITLPDNDGLEFEVLFNRPTGDHPEVVHTTLRGSINLGKAQSTSINYIDFVAPAAYEKAAVYNGNAVVDNCCFSGYPTALDGVQNLITCDNCLFYNNGVAVNIDFGTNVYGAGWSNPAGNLFLCNGTAFRLRSFSSVTVRPSTARFVNNDFISNGTDIDTDLGDPASVYFCYNYYGEKTGSIDAVWAANFASAVAAANDASPNFTEYDLVVSATPAALSIAEGSTLYANPRWGYPVSDPQIPTAADFFDLGTGSLSTMNTGSLFLCEAVTENFNTVDWVNKTRILNDEAWELRISPKAFAADADRVIEVADNDEDGEYLVATWNFSGDFSGATEDFSAEVQVMKGVYDDSGKEHTFVLVDDSDVLSSGTCSLTVELDRYEDCSGWDKAVVKSIDVATEQKTEIECTLDKENNTVTFVPTAGFPVVTYVIEGYTAPSGGGGGSTATAEEPAPINYAEIADETFSDVEEENWFATAIGYCSENELFAGYPDGTYKPAETVTRAMVMTVLAKLKKAELTAVAGEPWYKPFVDWAVAEGITDGTNPENIISREQLVVMMWNLSGKPESEYDVSAFGDTSDIDYWALPAVRWAVEKGLIAGKTGNRIDPLGSATRAELAQIMYNFCENVEKKAE